MRQVPAIHRARGEMLPLMDMIFLLLVLFIFMIVQMRPDFGIAVELPDVGEEELVATPEQQANTVTVSVTTANELFVNKEAVALEDLAEVVRRAAEGAADEKISVVLRGDTQADYGRMVELFTVLRKNNLNNVVFDVEPKKDESAE